MSRVTVIVPTYNRPDYLRIALASVQAQTYRDFDVIVQDNGSDADLRPIIAEFADINVTYTRHSHNIGQTANIVDGIRRAAGTYIALLADDDCWRSDFLERMVAALDLRPDCVLAFANYDLIDDAGKVMPMLTANMMRYHGNHLVATGYHQPFETIATVYRAITVISGCVLRRDAADWAAIPTTLTVGSDTYLGFLAARTGGACYFDSAPLFQVRHHAGTVTAAANHNAQDIIAKYSAYVVMWDHILNDETMRCRGYYRMKRDFYICATIMRRLLAHDWRAATADLLRACRHGIVMRLPFYHLGYLARLRWIGIHRRFLP